MSSIDDRLEYGDLRLVVAGQTIRVDDPPIIGERGLHAARSLAECLVHAPGSTIWRVRMSGEVHESGPEIAATERTPLWRVRGAEIILGFARKCAREALWIWPLYKSPAVDAFLSADLAATQPALASVPIPDLICECVDEADSLFEVIPLIGERLRQRDRVAGMQAASGIALWTALQAHQAARFSDRAMMRWASLAFIARLFAAAFAAADYDAAWRQRFFTLNQALEAEVWQRAFELGVTTPDAERDWQLSTLSAAPFNR